jgi:type I restriction enzyme M protein
MKISDVLQKTKNPYALDLFSPATITFVEKQMFERADKAYLRCQVRGKDVIAKSEEIVRQLWIHRLIAYFKYPVSRLQGNFPIIEMRLVRCTV